MRMLMNMQMSYDGERERQRQREKRNNATAPVKRERKQKEKRTCLIWFVVFRLSLSLSLWPVNGISWGLDAGNTVAARSAWNASADDAVRWGITRETNDGSLLSNSAYGRHRNATGMREFRAWREIRKMPQLWMDAGSWIFVFFFCWFSFLMRN